MAEKLIIDAQPYAVIENGSKMCVTNSFICLELYMVENAKKVSERIAVVVENVKGVLNNHLSDEEIITFRKSL